MYTKHFASHCTSKTERLLYTWIDRCLQNKSGANILEESATANGVLSETLISIEESHIKTTRSQIVTFAPSPSKGRAKKDNATKSVAHAYDDMKIEDLMESLLRYTALLLLLKHYMYFSPV